MNKQKIQASDEAWDARSLGNHEDFVEVVDETNEIKIDEASGVAKMITLTDVRPGSVISIKSEFGNGPLIRGIVENVEADIKNGYPGVDYIAERWGGILGLFDSNPKSY